MQAQHVGSGDGKSFLPLAVDGRKNPERIPDRIAYYHFIQSNAESATPAQTEISRRNIRLAGINLSEDDQRLVVGLLRGIKDELKQAQALAKGASSSPERAHAAKVRRDEILSRVRMRVQTELSTDGVSRLDAFIQKHVKPSIRIYGDLPSE